MSRPVASQIPPANRRRRRSPDSLLPHSCYPARGPRSAARWREVAGTAGKEANEQMKWRLLLPGASEPRLTELNPLGLQDGFSDCVTQPEQPEQSCRWQLLQWPDNGGTMPSKSSSFTPSSILFRPRRSPLPLSLPACGERVRVGTWVEAPGTAPGSERFITTSVYRHSRVTPAGLNIGANG